jgi:hypothetical protein
MKLNYYGLFEVVPLSFWKDTEEYEVVSIFLGKVIFVRLLFPNTRYIYQFYKSYDDQIPVKICTITRFKVDKNNEYSSIQTKNVPFNKSNTFLELIRVYMQC